MRGAEQHGTAEELRGGRLVVVVIGGEVDLHSCSGAATSADIN